MKRPLVLFVSFVLSFCALLLFSLHPRVTTVAGHIRQAAREELQPAQSANLRDEADEPDQFLEFQRSIRTANGEDGPRYPANHKMAELDKARNRWGILLKKGSAVTWAEKGPGNVGGRTRGLIVDPDDASKNTWFAGSVGGGVWKTTDGGTTWTIKTPNVPNLATSSIAMAASNHNVIYAGTGEGFYNGDAIRGDGIWKSTDRGETWSQISSTASNSNFSFVNRIVVSPTDENVVVAATRTGILRTTDGGTTWTKTYSTTSTVSQLIANPQNFQALYSAANGTGVLRSYDGGLTWALASNGITGISGGAVFGSRLELAIAPTDTQRIYAAVETNILTSDIYLSTNGGSSWQSTKQASGTAINWLNGQGWYDNTIAVHPWNKDVVFVGGLDLYRVQVDTGATTISGVTSVEQNNTASFLAFVNAGLPYADGGLATGVGFLGATNIVATDYVSVEVRFGVGKSQKAHRFVRNTTSGTYEYRDYVTVPFEVWDITNSRQLMASFRDSTVANGVAVDQPGVFDLIPFDALNPQREYVFAHAVPYNAVTPDANIAFNNGYQYKNIYAFWPTLAAGATWNPNALPTSNLRINYGSVSTRARSMTKLTYWLPNQPNPAGGTYPFVHADQHNITMIPGTGSNFRILNANDGGVEISNDTGKTWSKTLNGYNTTQFYGVDKKHNSDEFIGGMQDNGTWRSAANPTRFSLWTNQIGGDGFDVSWNYADGNKIIGSVYYNSIYRSTDGGTTWNSATTDLLDVGGGKSPFITGIAKSNIDPDLLFVTGVSGVWRSDNFSENWTLSPITISNWGYTGYPRVAISLKNPRIVWAAAQMSSSGKVNVSTDGGITFNPRSVYPTATLGRITALTTHPTQDSTAYVLFSFAQKPKILRTTDLGATWTDISGFWSNTTSNNGFPDVATYCVLVMPHNPSEIWAGTEIGLFISTDNGSSWAYANNGLPAVSIWQMRVVDDKVVVATHGRGVWTGTIPELLTAPLPSVTLSPRLNKMAQGPDGNLTIGFSLRSSYDSTVILNKSARFTALPANASAKDTLIRYTVTQADTLSITVLSYKSGVAYSSSSRKAGVILLSAPQASYVDNMNAANSNYVASGFTLQQPAGFSDLAYHSPHPYSNLKNYILQLKIPIVVRSSNAFLRFDEIALVEPGDPGAKFGDLNFWDYVVVEATKDGLTWTPIEDGYDVQLYQDWLTAWNTATTPTAALIHNHSTNLLNKFAPGDNILIRFRMFADEALTGWGWVIDNLEIQGSLTGVDQLAALPLTYDLSQNYPNPFNPSTTIRFSIPKESYVSLKIYDIVGRLVGMLIDRKLQPGRYTETWNANALASGVYFYRLEASDFVDTKKLLLLK